MICQRLRFFLISLYCVFLSFILQGTFLHARTVTEDFDVDYVVGRLKRHIKAFSQFNKKNKKLQVLPTARPITDSLYADTAIIYEHGLTKLCAKKMLQEGNLTPLFETWKLFTSSFKSVDPHIFLRECAIMLFSLYKNFLVEASQRRPMNVSVDQVIELYEKIHTLPIGKVLDALDDCCEQFTQILREYGISTDDNWSEWLANNWWVPPVAAGSLAYTVFQREKIQATVSEGQKNIRRRIKEAL